jgi:hypothetical protein
MSKTPTLPSPGQQASGKVNFIYQQFQANSKKQSRGDKNRLSPYLPHNQLPVTTTKLGNKSFTFKTNDSVGSKKAILGSS